jgi:hypothetical protein
MKYTREQMVLIFTMLKAQHGDKTFKDLFGVNTDGSYSGKVEDLSICYGHLGFEFLFLFDNGKPIASFMTLDTQFLVLSSNRNNEIKIDIKRN